MKIILLIYQSIIFPSPVGELHFSININIQIGLNNPISVPCRGTTFLNRMTLNCLKLLRKHFRPLSGNYISQSVSSATVFTQRTVISVPCRGTTFLNTIPTIPPPVWAHGRDCVGKIFLEKQIKFIRLNRQQTQYLSHARQNPNRYSLLLRNINFTLSHHIFFPLIAGTFQNMW